jgi:hypothetical protein
MRVVGQCIHTVPLVAHPSSWLLDLQFMSTALDDKCILMSSHKLCNTRSKFKLACNIIKHSGVPKMTFSLYLSSRCIVHHTIL